MPERVILREHFNEMLQTVSAAADEYGQLASATTEPTRQEQLRRLTRDKSRHVELTERLLEILDE